jgi:CRP/FNR family transcriptional regulator
MGAEPTELLTRVPLFAELSASELERVASVAIPRSYPKGVRVFHEGDQSDACYIVRAGDLRVTREHSDGRAIALATLGPGDIFGELAMLDGGSRSASVETLTDAELVALPAVDVRRVISDHGDIAAKLIVAITRRLRETNERVARQSFQTVPSRVAGVLSQLIAEEAIPEERRGITVRMTQADLAQLAGTSRESVSRFLATLERAGVVSVGRGRVTVLEPRRLRAYIF